MIRINLLEQRRPEKGEAKTAVPTDRMAVVGITVIVLLTVAFIGWRWYSLNHRLARLREEIPRRSRNGRS